MQALAPDVPVLILTGHGTVASAVECLKAGATDYILKPVDPEALELSLERALERRALRREVRYLRSAVAGAGGSETAIGDSAAWKRVVAMVEAAAPTDSGVLLTGESGTGKELLARRLHALSRARPGPFVRVNCAAVPLEMWESEFFGHRKGSFTGAQSDRDGRFQLADRGTLLLDEVGAMPAAGQAKLLRVIQDGEFERLGDEQPTRVDVRIVASTNSDLEAEVQAGPLPRRPLLPAERGAHRRCRRCASASEDIPLLARHFIGEIAARLGPRGPGAARESLARLAAYHWPGNVRELRNVIERALILDPGPRPRVAGPGPGGRAAAARGGCRSHGGPRAQPARVAEPARARAAARGAAPRGRRAQGGGAPARDRSAQPRLLPPQARPRAGRQRGVAAVTTRGRSALSRLAARRRGDRAHRRPVLQRAERGRLRLDGRAALSGRRQRADRPEAMSGGSDHVALGVLMHVGVAFFWSAVFLYLVLRMPWVEARCSRPATAWSGSPRSMDRSSGW